ncbi:MAG: hypothetical protein ACREQL_12610 [Candidatus Binatia bacterium]
MAATHDQLFIVRDLVGYAQAQSGGNIGVIVGTETSGRKRDRVYRAYERQNIGEAVERLAAVDDGFDFAVDVAYEAGTITKRLNLAYPRRGRITPIVFELGTNIEALAEDVDAGRQANQVDALGNGEGDSMLISTAADTSQLATYPLLETVYSFKDVSVVANLADHAALALARTRRPVMTIPVLLAAQANPDAMLGTYIVGDSVTVRGSDGWISLDERMRIQAINVAVDGNGRETVGLQFAQEEASFV